MNLSGYRARTSADSPNATSSAATNHSLSTGQGDSGMTDAEIEEAYAAQHDAEREVDEA